MIHPLVPIVCDTWCHAFSEINHLATVHAKYGTHHLEISLSKNSDNTNDKNSNSSKTETSDTNHLLINTCKIIIAHQLPLQFTLTDTAKLVSIFIGINIPPPKIAC